MGGAETDFMMWTTTKDSYFNDWDYFLQITPLPLFAYNGERWTTFKRSPVHLHSCTASFFYLASHCDPPPLLSLHRTSIIKRGGSTFSVEYFALLESFIEPWIGNPTPPTGFTPAFLFFLKQCKEFPWLADHFFDCSPNLDKIFSDFLAGTQLSVSNGSFNPEVKAGASAWCVKSIDGMQFICGGGRTPGSLTSQGVYCSKLAGLLGLLMVLWSLEKAVIALASPPRTYCWVQWYLCSVQKYYKR